MMPDQRVWYSKKSITIYHLSKNCSALKSVRPKDLVDENIDLNSDKTTDETGMRLCLICEREREGMEDILDRYFT